MAGKTRNRRDKASTGLQFIPYVHKDDTTGVHVPKVFVDRILDPPIPHEEILKAFKIRDYKAARQDLDEENARRAARSEAPKELIKPRNTFIMFLSAGTSVAKKMEKGNDSIVFSDIIKVVTKLYGVLTNEERAIWQKNQDEEAAAYRAVRPGSDHEPAGLDADSEHANANSRLDGDGLGLVTVSEHPSDSDLAIAASEAAVNTLQPKSHTRAASHRASVGISRVNRASEFAVGGLQRVREEFVQGSSKRRAEDLPIHFSPEAAVYPSEYEDSGTPKRRRTAAPPTVASESSNDIALFMPEWNQLRDTASPISCPITESPISQELLELFPSLKPAASSALAVPDVYRPQLQEYLSDPYPPPSNDFAFFPALDPSTSSQFTEHSPPNIPYVAADLTGTDDFPFSESPAPLLLLDGGSPTSMASTVEETSPPPTVPGPMVTFTSSEIIDDFMKDLETIPVGDHASPTPVGEDLLDFSWLDFGVSTAVEETADALVAETMTMPPPSLDQPTTTEVPPEAHNGDSFASAVALIAKVIGVIPRDPDEIIRA